MFSNDKKLQNVADAVSKIMNEKLHPNQQKLDVHEPEKDKLTADDFKKLRAGKKPVSEAMSKADVPTVIRNKMGEKPLTMTDVKSPRKDSISSPDNLAKARGVKEDVEQLKEYESKSGVYKHKGTYGTEKSTEAGYTDYDKENELAKKNLKEPKKKKYGARQNFVRSTRVNETFSGLINTYNENGIKGLFESLNIEEEVEQLDEISVETMKSAKDKLQNKAFQSHMDDNKYGAQHYAGRAVDMKKKIDQKEKMNKEEVEQIDEISKQTLGSYVNKASSSIADKSAEAQHKRTKAVVDHDDNIRRGMSKKGADTHLNRGYDSAKPDIHKVKTRIQGVQKAISRLTKEEVEQLDELSPGTLKSYVQGAKADVQNAKDERDSARSGGDGKGANDAYQLAKKRTAGIKTAKAKLNKEEVEYVEVQVTDFDDVNGVTVQTIDAIEERTLTEPEMKKKEEVVKSMKKGLSGFKARYGDDAKSVMYATATKIAKKD